MLSQRRHRHDAKLNRDVSASMIPEGAHCAEHSHARPDKIVIPRSSNEGSARSLLGNGVSQLVKVRRNCFTMPFASVSLCSLLPSFFAQISSKYFVYDEAHRNCF